MEVRNQKGKELRDILLRTRAQIQMKASQVLFIEEKLLGLSYRR